jgi:DNA polymerase-3 subunit gamma/tau
MSYQVIARKWRPQTFEDVTGQEPITRTLRNAIEHERLHHAYLFSGARGVGKTTTARLLAKALNCHKSKSPTPLPCAINDPDVCSSCREIAEGRSIDVMEIDAASNTGVDNVRDAIIGSVGISPARDRYKVFIIDEVHMLSGAAFNALLKTLEEPPAGVVFVLATTERHKVPDTILSRCQLFEFRTIAAAKIAERLREIARAEGISVPDDALREIALAGEGSMRDAQSAFDQVISFSGPEIRVEDVETALGIAGGEMLARTVRAIAGQNPAEGLAIVDDLVMRGHDLRNFCRELMGHLRNLLVAKVSGEGSDLIESSAEHLSELRRQASDFSESDLVRFFHSLSETEANLRLAVNQRYQVEIGLIKLMEMRRLAPIGEIMARLSALEESIRDGQSPGQLQGLDATPAATARPLNSEPGSTTRLAGASASPSTEAQGNGSEPASSEATRSEAAAPRLKTASFSPGNLAGNSRSFAPAAYSANEASAPAVQREEAAKISPETSATGIAATASPVESLKAALEQRRKMLIVSALDGARRVSVENDELCVEFAPESKHLRDNLAKPENIRVLREVCKEVFGRDTGIQITIKGPDVENGGPASKEEEERREKQRLREIAENHPAVKQMLETFRAQIVDVRRVESEK